MPMCVLQHRTLQADPETFVAEVDAASADAIVLPGVLQRLHRPGAFLEAVSRLLRPFGVLALALDYAWDAAKTPHGEWLLPPGDARQVGSPALLVDTTYCNTYAGLLVLHCKWISIKLRCIQSV